MEARPYRRTRFVRPAIFVNLFYETYPIWNLRHVSSLREQRKRERGRMRERGADSFHGQFYDSRVGIGDDELEHERVPVRGSTEKDYQ